MRRVLVIEDDRDTAKQVADYVARGGYQCDVAPDGDHGLRLGSNAYVAMTVDRMLPGIDGLEVLRRLRSRAVTTPALIISALGEVDERVRGLRAGGDDYLVKPFAFSEMLARIDALARRSSSMMTDIVLRVGDLQIDLIKRTVSRGENLISLLPREFRLLEYMVRNAGQVISRSMLLQHVWDLHFDPGTNIIDVYVARLRRKVDSGASYPLIHTARGIGFCIRAPD
jgi:two-component system, OmpR family, response regulator